VTHSGAAMEITAATWLLLAPPGVAAPTGVNRARRPQALPRSPRAARTGIGAATPRWIRLVGTVSRGGAIQKDTGATGPTEFIIGDVPAVTFDANRNAVGVRPAFRAGAVSQSVMDPISQLQFRASQSYVCYRPSAHVASQISAWRPVRDHG